MRLIFPRDISLESSNVAEALYSEWLAITSYTAGDYVYVTKETDTVTDRTPHKIYKALADNSGKFPPDNIAEWQDQGGTNRWKMFDNFLDTQTENATSIVVSIDAGSCDKFMLFNLDAKSVAISLTDNDTSTVVQTATYDLELAAGSYKKSLIGDIYIYADATLQLTISNAGGTAKCGLCAPGWSTYVGDALFGIRPGIKDYSIKDGYYLSKGAWAKKLRGEFIFELADLDNTYDDLVDARSALIGVECNGYGTDYESLRAYGFIKDWRLYLKHVEHGIGDFDFQGVI